MAEMVFLPSSVPGRAKTSPSFPKRPTRWLFVTTLLYSLGIMESHLGSGRQFNPRFQTFLKPFIGFQKLSLFLACLFLYFISFLPDPGTQSLPSPAGLPLLRETTLVKPNKSSNHSLDTLLVIII